MHRFKSLYFVIFIINLYKIHAQISDKRLCVDEECKVPISHAKTLLRYSSPDSRILSFAPNVDITIYSKSAGSREDLWGGEINGKRGYVPKHMVRETKVLQKPTLLVDTEFANDTETKQVPLQVEPDKVQQPYEVVDGTTIYLNPQEDISPSSTESPIETTVLPVETNKISQNDADSQTASSSEILKTEPSSSQDQKITEEEVKSSSQTDQLTSQEIKNDVKVGDNTEENKVIEDKPELPEKVEILSEEDESEDEDDEADVDDEDEESPDEESEEQEGLSEKAGTEQNNATTDQGKTELKDDNVPDLTKEIHTEGVEATSKTPLQNVETTAQVVADINKEATENVLSEEIKPEKESSTINESKIEARSIETEDTNTKENSEESLISTNSTEKVEELVQTNENVTPKVEELVEMNDITSKVEDIIEKEDMVQPNEDITTGNIHADGLGVAPTIEITTLSPEIEVPQPFDDDFEVTPDPLHVSGESPAVKETISTLPPLGLFVGVNSDSLSAKVEDVQNTVQQPVEPVASTEELRESSVNENSAPMVEEVVEKEQNTSEETVKSSESDSSRESILEEIKENRERFKENLEDSNEWSSDEDTQATNEENQNNEVEENKNEGFFAGILSMFGSSSEGNTNEEQSLKKEELTSSHVPILEEVNVDCDNVHQTNEEPFCDATSCPKSAENEAPVGTATMDYFNFNSDVFLYLVTTAISVIIFLFGYIAFDKSKREGPLIAKINKLEKELLIILKENQILQEKVSTDCGYETNDSVSSEVIENLKQELFEMSNYKNVLEEQVQSLEKELENSTEVGMELNRMLSEILRSESGSDVLKSNVENLQRQLVEQQSTINSVNETLAVTNTENHELRLELELSNKKVLDLQAELDKLLLNILKIEEEKEIQQSTLESEIVNLRQRYEEVNNRLRLKEDDHHIELQQLQGKLEQAGRKFELKSKEYDILTDSLKQLKVVKNNESTLKNILEVSGTKAEYQQLKIENQRLTEKLQQEQELKFTYEKRAQVGLEETQQLKQKYDEVDKLRVEAQTKLEVLSNYFKDREAQWQKEISKHEALWAEKQGEATSTTERIKFMQDQLQNYKAQTESLKQEIMSQEIELKSQISVLEKKAHENWVSARQAERKLEEAKQEAAQLRHRLTLRERALQEDKGQHRLQSPIEQNGDMPLSPLESPASPPLLYGTRDHITKSPALPGLPPFLPPPPGVPFMPPPIHGVPPFIPPPPPNMFPGDHRPPPLGRMSSPPLNSRYSPSSRGYSPYDRNSSSPSDSEYGTSPPHRRGYSPFNNRSDDRRDYKRPPPTRNNGRNLMKGGGSSGSGHSNESLEKISRQQSKV